MHDWAEIITLLEAQTFPLKDKLSRVLSNETRLRETLQKLDRTEAVRQTQAANAVEMRLSGADMVWVGWVENARKSANIELARVMAEKLTLNDELQKLERKTDLAQEKLEESEGIKRQRQTELELARMVEISTQQIAAARLNNLDD